MRLDQPGVTGTSRPSEIRRFIETIEALAEADLSVRGTAAALYVHPNTVVYRLGRIRELTGFDPRHIHDLIAFLLALRSRIT